MSLRRVYAVAMVGMLGLLGTARGQTGDDTTADEKLLKQVGVDTDGVALLKFFEQRTTRIKDFDKIPNLVKQLGNRAFAQREKASKELTNLGATALPELRRALRAASDPEIKLRLVKCISELEGRTEDATLLAGLRLLAQRHPEGAAEMLLRFAPLVDTETEDEFLAAFLVVGVRAGKVEPIVLDALKDKEIVRRAAAALVLGRSGTEEQRKAVYPLLTDKEAIVRLRAAQGLVAGRDKSAVAVLIPLLTEGTPDVAIQAEDLLARVADKTAPKLTLGPENQEAVKCRLEWEQWWKEHEKTVDLKKVDVEMPLTSSVRRANRVCDQFFSGLLKGDNTLLKKVTAAPFMMDTERLQTREQLDKQMEAICQHLRQETRKNSYRITGQMSAEEYLPHLTRNDNLKQQLKQLPLRELRLVFVKLLINGEGAEAAFTLVRLRGTRAEVVGFCLGEMPQNKK